jgi:beta-1,4-mannosyltransferase
MYPKNDYATLESPNPYVQNLEKALSDHHTIINQKPNYHGVIELFSYLFRADIFFFNWIEDVSVKRFGKIQQLIFPLFLFLAKIFRKKIIWILHNLYSHESKNRKWTRFGFNLMIKHSDLILTHSNEGVEFVRDRFPDRVKKVKYLIHPIDEIFPVSESGPEKYDILIWGTIHPYKGVIEFLEFVHECEDMHGLKILISGICPHPALKLRLQELLNTNIEYRDGFFSMDEIYKMTGESRFSLFTYNSDSILSSGSLMDSIRMRAMIIGPDKGSFRDLNSFGFLHTYDAFADIPDIISRYTDRGQAGFDALEYFCNDNSWKNFYTKLSENSDGILLR